VAERVRITLVCSVCDARNYRTTKAATAEGRSPEALLLKKHCPTCGKHTPHRESK
jgi:large subunit ribosomal protein L33